MHFVKKNKFLALILFLFVQYFGISFLFGVIGIKSVASVNVVNAAGLGAWQTNLDDATASQAQNSVYNNIQGDSSSALANYIGDVLLIFPFVGVLFLIRLVWGGYIWLTSAGNEEKIGEAKRTILHSTIGVVLIAALYVISYFIISSLARVTGYNAGF